MRAIQKIVRCGGASHFTIPRAAMFYLGWVTGQQIMLEVLEDRSIRIRPLTHDDFSINGVASIKVDNTAPVFK